MRGANLELTFYRTHCCRLKKEEEKTRGHRVGRQPQLLRTIRDKRVRARKAARVAVAKLEIFVVASVELSLEQKESEGRAIWSSLDLAR